MVFEHFALNVEDPIAISKWYVENCEMKLVRSMDDEPYTRFLADKTGRVVMEIYSNRTQAIPDYKNQHPLLFHFAFMVDDSVAVKDKLIKAGAEKVEDINLPDGSILFMLRDPFGIPLQICQRAVPMMKI